MLQESFISRSTGDVTFIVFLLCAAICAKKRKAEVEVGAGGRHFWVGFREKLDGGL